MTDLLFFYLNRDAIISTLEKTNVLIIAGDTGCGKSTQVPQYLLSANYTNIGKYNEKQTFDIFIFFTNTQSIQMIKQKIILYSIFYMF